MLTDRDRLTPTNPTARTRAVGFAEIYGRLTRRSDQPDLTITVQIDNTRYVSWTIDGFASEVY